MITGTRCTCGKTRYATEIVAERELAWIAGVSHRRQVPVRAYRGPCGWVHLTSLDLTTYTTRAKEPAA